MTTLLLAAAMCVSTQQALFDFHSAFWMNLHHYLHALARAAEPLDAELPASATDAERRQWAAAVDFYRTRYGKRRLVFDKTLVAIKQQLIDAESSESIGALKLTPEHRGVLERAAPVYRRLLWPAHDAANQSYIDMLQGLIGKHGQLIADRLGRSYDSAWPADGLRVDVVHDAGPPGNAYTTTVPRPTHITIGAQDLGLMTLELIFHEASHNWDQQLMKAVADVARQSGLRAPPDLWHALLFVNAGLITGDVLEAAGVPDYQLLMVHGRVFDRPGWHDSLQRHWPVYLRGEISRDEAILRILRDLAGA